MSPTLPAEGLLTRIAAARRRRWRIRALCSGALSVVVTVGLLGQAPTLAAAAATKLSVQKAFDVPAGRAAKPAKTLADPAKAASLKAAPAVRWPVAATTTVDLAPALATATGARSAVQAAGTPVSVDAPVTPGKTTTTLSAPVRAATPAAVTVQVLDHAAATKAGAALVVKLSRADGSTAAGKANVSIDYSSFAHAYGGDWSDRLRLVQLPACALATPAAPACVAIAAPFANNPRTHTITATATLAAATGAASPSSPDGLSADAGVTVMALTSGSSSSAGDFGATPLKASSTWSAGGQSGGFEWNYPMRVPPSLGGPSPDIALNYTSQSVDGEMAASNNQPGDIGEGFDYQPGSISRSYKSCADDMGGTATNTTKTGDQCWGSYNATLSMPGHAGELIKDDTSGTWRLKGDDNTKVQLLTGASNGDNDGEYWLLTTSDGTRYYFGQNRLFGWTTGKPVTNSVNTVPVFGNNPGEPCYNSSFASAYCNQAWQWNLDYVVDTHGNTESFWYTQETNNYARDNNSASVSSYVRGSYLTRIDYGTDERTSSTDTDYTATKAPMKVDFTVADRCVTAGASCVSTNPSDWPDVPWDQYCSSSTSCTDYSPTFFTQKRLDTVQTSVWNATTAAYDPVESWTLHQSYPDPGDTTRAGLWLNSISHTGLYGGTATVPDVTFDGVQMQNRVDTVTDGSLPMNWWRVADITTETGDKISVTYSPQDCVAGQTPAPDSNSRRCYPVYWTRPGETNPRIDWFHKYVVTDVTENDVTTAGATRTHTHYDYATNGPMWHYDDDNGLVPVSRKTWAQFRGYSTVTTTVGDTGDPQTQTKALYFQGMNGDKTSTGTRSVTVTDSTGAHVNDDDTYAGMVREKITYNGPGGAEVSGEIDDPWKSAATATRTVNGVTVSAYHTGTAASHTRVDLDGGRGLRTTESDTTFDSYGMATQVWDKGDLTKTGDDTCVNTTYLRNTSLNILDTVQRESAYALPCGTTPSSSNDVISDVENSFDGAAYGTAPTKGDVTTTQTAKAWTNPTTQTWLTTAASVYDVYGRVTDATDVRGNHTGTAYTPTTGGPVTKVTTTINPTGTQNPLNWTSYVEIAPGYGETTGSVDINNKRTDTTYDPLGRATAQWLPNRVKGTDTANTTISYAISNTVPSVVTTNKLIVGGGYLPSYTFYDGLLRPRQTQTIGAGGGKIINETFYNSVGETVKASGPYYNGSGGPSTTLFPTPLDQNVPSQTTTGYDGAGRATTSTFLSMGAPQWTSTTAYGGDRTDVTPPTNGANVSGGTPTSTYTDALGRTIEVRQYAGLTPTGSNYDDTTYHFNEKGQNDSVTDGAGHTWTYVYDLLGRKTSSTDPDTGATTMTYDDAGDLLTSKDANNVTVAYDYTDPLGRKVGEWQTAVGTGVKLATWTYDTVAKGQLASSSRWVGANEYKTAVLGYTPLYQVAATRLTVPSSEGILAGTYQYSTTYNIDGTVNQQTIPAAGDLLGEHLTYTYDGATGQPLTMTTDYGGTSHNLVTNTQYTSYGEPNITTFADSGTAPWAQQALTYDPATHRLAEAKTAKSTSPFTLADIHYSYDPAGNLTKAADTPAGGAQDTQCFTYDGLRRLTSAWTPSSGDCTTAPTVAGLGGAAPYWQSWTFDTTNQQDPTSLIGSTGNRLSQTTHAAGGDTEVDYTYNTTGHAHAVSATTTKVGGTQTGTAAYSYDTDGNTTSRPGPHGQQTLTWDPEGHLATLTDTSGSYNYVYNPDGSRLTQHDPSGTTLYLADTELRLTTSSQTKTATRYYTYNGQQIAVRSTTGLQFCTGDPHGTNTIQITDDATQTVTHRYQDPYGNPRGTNPTWTGDKAFIGGTQDPTGLIHEGAREYDPALGKFITIDPQFDQNDSQSWNGYAYGDNSPGVNADPTGLCIRLDDSSGPCAETLSHKNGWAQYHARELRWAHQRAVAHARYEAQRLWLARLNRRTGENMGNGYYKAQAKPHPWWRNTIDAIGNCAPALDVIALATAEIPGLDAVTATMAIMANGASAASSYMNLRDDINDHKSGLQTGLDAMSMGLSLVGISGTSVLKGIPKVAKGLDAAAEDASTLSRGFSKTVGSGPGQVTLAAGASAAARTMSDGLGSLRTGAEAATAFAGVGGDAVSLADSYAFGGDPWAAVGFTAALTTLA